MKNLREKNHITVTDAGYIYLTESGKAIADMIYERHQLLTSCLEKLGVSAEIAEKDACKIEHVISKESFEAIKEYVKANIAVFIVNTAIAFLLFIIFLSYPLRNSNIVSSLLFPAYRIL